jgi:hypothetical protein
VPGRLGAPRAGRTRATPAESAGWAHPGVVTSPSETSSPEPGERGRHHGYGKRVPHRGGCRGR